MALVAKSWKKKNKSIPQTIPAAVRSGGDCFLFKYIKESYIGIG
jgi:hypothetical protein